jgi:hypothetical protein
MLIVEDRPLQIFSKQQANKKIAESEGNNLLFL